MKIVLMLFFLMGPVGVLASTMTGYPQEVRSDNDGISFSLDDCKSEESALSEINQAISGIALKIDELESYLEDKFCEISAQIAEFSTGKARCSESGKSKPSSKRCGAMEANHWLVKTTDPKYNAIINLITSAVASDRPIEIKYSGSMHDNLTIYSVTIK
ncbi:MAG: hypothetical protein HOO06_03195 [Bdellovibrionaceae bacterium]|jgi:hypothetical protein|nr:hypothetical protein [Pseudobdellovibrionaceae bacterium]